MSDGCASTAHWGVSGEGWQAGRQEVSGRQAGLQDFQRKRQGLKGCHFVTGVRKLNKKGNGETLFNVLT